MISASTTRNCIMEKREGKKKNPKLFSVKKKKKKKN